MNRKTLRILAPRGIGAFLTSLILGLICLAAMANAQTTGTITGRVGNQATKLFLKGASVNLPSLNKQTLTGDLGDFTFIDVPAGDYQLEVSYIGLDPQTVSVHVDGGRQAVADVNLTSSIYKLDALKVTGTLEGNALAITSQRTAPNLTNVAALDSLGNLPNFNAGELLIRLPGVAASLDAENNVQGVIIRGFPSALTTVSIDGNQESSPGGMGRSFQTHSISGALFESVEVVKAPTPDMAADSIAGNVNLKTRDPLSMQSDKEFIYNVSDRWAPSFLAETPTRRDHAQQPLMSAQYQGVYSVLGGERNLGIALSAFYSENATGYSESGNNLYQQSLAEPAYMYQYQTIDGYNNRKQKSTELTVEYRLSDHMQISFNALYNDAFEPYNPIYTATAATGQTIATIGANGQPTGTGAILPGYTDSVTNVLPVAASKMTLNSTEFSFIDRQREFQLAFKNDFDRLHLNYGGNYNYAHPNLGNGFANGNNTGGIFTMSLPNVGWTVDQSKSALNPSFTQTAGPSVYNGANYGSGLMVTRNNHRDTDTTNANFDALYDLPTSFASSIKAGYRLEQTKYYNAVNAYEWNYVGSAPLSTLADPTIRTYDEQRTGQMLPFVNSSYVAQQIIANPSAWSQNLYYHTQQGFIGTNTVKETVNAAYVQAKARFGKLELLAGVRMEQTDEYGFGYVQSPTLSTAAQQAANPVAAANADYNNVLITNGKYTNYFPGLFATYHFTKQLQARADYSTSIGRPTAADVVPSQTPNTTANTLTIANPSLKAELAKNVDLDLEYYFEPVGELSVGWFHKDISNYIASSSIGTVGFGQNNGYQGNYQGYTLLSNVNAGNAQVSGWELAYQQRFTFLPGALKGLGFFANYTQLVTRGNYGGSANLAGNQVASFVPKTGNMGFNYQYKRFGARVLVNYTGRFLNTANTNAAVQLFRYARTIANVGFSYELSRAATLSLDLTNPFNEPQGEYYGVPTRRGLTIVDYTTVTFGVSGKF